MKVPRILNFTHFDIPAQGPTKTEQYWFGPFALFGQFNDLWRSDCSVFELFGVRAVHADRVRVSPGPLHGKKYSIT